MKACSIAIFSLHTYEKYLTNLKDHFPKLKFSFFFFFRSFIKRSLSDGNIVCDSQIPISNSDAESIEPVTSAFPSRIQQDSVVKGLCDSTPEISTCDDDIQYCR